MRLLIILSFLSQVSVNTYFLDDAVENEYSKDLETDGNTAYICMVQS